MVAETLFYNNLHPCWVFDIATFQFVAVNRTAEKVFGYTEDELLHDITMGRLCEEDIKKCFNKKSAIVAFRQKNGGRFHLCVFPQKVNFKGRDCCSIMGVFPEVLPDYRLQGKAEVSSAYFSLSQMAESVVDKARLP